MFCCLGGSELQADFFFFFLNAQYTRFNFSEFNALMYSSKQSYNS